MFLFRNPVYAYRLYAFGRQLAGFGVQNVLKGLPLRFLTRLPCRSAVPDLPEAPEKRLTRFLTRYGVPEQTLAFFLNLYTAGDGLQDLLFASLWELEDFARSAQEKDQKRAADLIKLFYSLELHIKKSAKNAEIFESLLKNELDFRLEASLLERINDFFYEDDQILTASPDWFATTKNRLEIRETPALRPFQDASDKHKAAVLLIQALAALLFRDGVILPPFPANLRTNGQSDVFFSRARMPLFLKSAERDFLAAFVEAVILQKPQAAAKALAVYGYTAESLTAVAETIIRFEKEAAGLPLSGKAERFITVFPERPFLFRYVAFVLKALEKLCRPAFETDDGFEQTVLACITEALPERKNGTTDMKETADRFRQAFSLLPHHLERLTMQNKKPPAFLSDAGKLSEILSRQSVSTQFRYSKHRLWKILLLIGATGILIASGLFWKPF